MPKAKAICSICGEEEKGNMSGNIEACGTCVVTGKYSTKKKETIMADKKKKGTKKSKKAATKKKSTAKKSTRLSKSGKYKSVRHLVETIFARKKDTTAEAMEKEVKKEYPQSAFTAKTHYPWYKTRIVNRREFVTDVKVPKWAKGGAKIK